MNWLEQYRAKCVSATEAMAKVESGNRVYIGAGCAVPHDLVAALSARAESLTDVEVIHILTVGAAPYIDRELAGHIRCNALFVGYNVREAINEGRADYVPIHLHQIPRVFKDGPLPLDVACVVVSPPDEHGFCSFGIEVGVTKPAAQSARYVVAEINRLMPRTLGDSFIHVSKLDACVEIDRPLDTFQTDEIPSVAKEIGRNVASLIEDGACLQLGIGGISEAVLDYLEDKKDLGIHTEMFSDGLQDLMEKGIVTGERKNFHPGKVVAGFVLGSQDIYDFVHDNPLIEFHPTDYVNNPFNIARNDNMVAVNSALQIDLTGQICADSLGKFIYSGFGGQVDFMRGAALSQGGLPICALPATAKEGTISRIVPYLSEGAGVVTTRADAHVVITENGIAWMYGRNVRQRAEALIAIADPSAQEELYRAAHERGLFGKIRRGVDLGSD
ncbi:MAG: acetyl-CoA hydrolase/transferase C-terminal domain-containing protein [bacterium]